MVDTLKPPIEVILSWPKPNYENPETHGPALTICVSIFSGLGILLVLARTYSRIFITRAPGADDALIILGLLLSLALGSLILKGIKMYGADRHIWDIPPVLFADGRRNIWMSEWIYVAGATCIKISILLFYRRLSVSFNRIFKWGVTIGFAYNIAVLLTCLIWLFVLCEPMDAYWNMYNPKWTDSHKYKCRTEQVSLPLSGALSTVGDLYATLLPFLLIREVAQSTQQKIGLYTLFGLGFLTVVCGIARTIYLYNIINKVYDMTWLLSPMWIWTIVELHIGIFVASAPALRPLFHRFVRNPITRRTNTGAATAPSPGPGKRLSSRLDMSKRASSARSPSLITDIDVEKIGVARGSPTEAKISSDISWVELRDHDEDRDMYELQQRVTSGLATLDEESTTSSRPRSNNIAIAH